jgi:glycosyltransferase involved in cell wall biosynthesis
MTGKMLIGIDGRPFLGRVAGTGRYVSELCRVLDAALPHARFIVFSNVPLTLPVENSRWSVVGESDAWARKLSPFKWYVLRAGRLARQCGVDAFWGGANFLPLGLPRRMRAVITLHDVVHRLFPRSLSTTMHQLAYRAFFRPSLRRADVVVCNSHGTSARLRELGYRAADLVVPPCASAAFAPQPMQAVMRMRETLGISGAYLLSVSTLEPRKNLDRLVHAYLEMRQGGELGDVSLVLAGQAGWKTSRLSAAIARAGDSASWIRTTGYVPEELLPALYTGSEAVIMPSLYEGFGMPVLEARMCGARVVATDIPEFREAGGDGAIYVPPTVGAIQAGIRTALASERCAPLTTSPPRWEHVGLKLAHALAGQ